MTTQITLEEALKLVSFYQLRDGGWHVVDVNCNIYGNIYGAVNGTINGREWKFIETPKEKLKRLIEESDNNSKLIDAFNEMEDNS